MASESGSLSEEASGSGCWSPAAAEGCCPDGDAEAAAGCKLFIYNLARTVTDDHLQPLFAPFRPLYCTVAIGKKGTSRRFGFAKFASREAAQVALDALKCTMLHGKEMDLKFAVALAEPDPASGIQPKLRAKQRAAAAQDLSPRIAAHPPPRLAGNMQLPPGIGLEAAPAALDASEATRPRMGVPLSLPLPIALPMPLPVPPGAAAPRGQTGPEGATMAPFDGARPGSTPPLPAAAASDSRHPSTGPLAEAPQPMQHMLLVQHGPGLSHDAVVQLVWCFRPIIVTVSAGPDPSGVDRMSSTAVFATLQQAHAAQAAVDGQSASQGRPAATSLVSIPLHQGPVPLPPLPPPQHLMPHGMAPPGLPPPQMRAPAHTAVQQAPLAEPQGLQPHPTLPPRSMFPPQLQPSTLPAQQQPPQPSQPAQPPAPAAHTQLQQQSQQQQPQREAVTMRPLYAVPRPPHLRPPHLPPPGYQYPSWQAATQPAGRPGPVYRVPAPGPPPFHFLSPAAGPCPGDGQQQPPAGAQPHPASTAPMPTLPDNLESPVIPKGLNPAAASFSPTKPVRLAPSAATASAQQGTQGPVGSQLVMPPVIHNIFSNIEAALAGRSFVPAWDRMCQQPCLNQELVMAEALEEDSGTEDEGALEPDVREVFAAVTAWNLNTCFVTRTLMRRLAPVEVLLKATAVGDPAAAPSVLTGAVVRVLIDKAYKLRQVHATYIKPDSGRLMLVLHDVNSPIPADHISNTNPLQSLPLGEAGEGELLELQAKLAFHGRRLFRHELATTAWHLQFAEHWQNEHGGKAGDELRLAAAHLRAMLCDEDEIRWRRRGIHGLDVGQETAMISRAFRLPWNAAANWMATRSPSEKLAACPGGSPGSAERSNVTGDYESRPALVQQEVLGLQHGARLLPSRAACRSLLRGAADPQQHEQYMAGVYGGQSHAGATALDDNGEGSAAQDKHSGSPAAAGSAISNAVAGREGVDTQLRHSHSHPPPALGNEAEEEAEEDPIPEWAQLQACNSEDQLLAEASTFGSSAGADGPPLPEFFQSTLNLDASPALRPKQTSSGSGNSSQQPSKAGVAHSRAATKAALATAAAHDFAHDDDGTRIPAVHARHC